MKTKFYWAALLASAAMIAQANAGGHHGGGGGHSDSSAAAPTRSAGVSSFHSMPSRHFGGRMIYSGRRFSPVGSQRFYRGGINRDGLARFGNNTHVVQNRNNSGRHNDAVTRRGNGAGRVARGTNLPRNWQNHVVTRHATNWHRDWDRSRDHRWHGHHCRFINGSWVIFDLGFYPWSFGYPYDYYYGDYYPYAYQPDYYVSGDYGDEDYYGQNAYDSSDAYADSAVAAAQEQLARRGYYGGEIDGVLGPQTRRAIARYQSKHGQRVTGELTTNTLEALGLGEVAND